MVAATAGNSVRRAKVLHLHNSSGHRRDCIQVLYQSKERVEYGYG
jgi:hypothetical protein